MKRILKYTLAATLVIALVACNSRVQLETSNIDTSQPTLTPSPIQSVKGVDDFHPILIQNHFVFGSYKNDEWVGEQDTANLITGAEVFKAYSLDKYLGSCKNAKAEVFEDGISVQVDSDYTPVIPNYEDDPFDSYYLQEVAIAGDWDVMPRTPRIQVGGIEAYEDLIREMLSIQGLNKQNVSIKKVIRVDLEGDGIEEVIITATDWDVRKAVEQHDVGTYSLVVLRKLLDGTIKNIIVKEQYTKDLTTENRYIYYTPMMLDIDGDGQIELFVEGRCNSWSLIEVLKVNGDKIEKVYSYEYGA